MVNSAETAILATTRFDAFGQTAAAYDSGASFPTPWRFQGRLDLSPDSHPLYDFGARNYDPAIGAFSQLDTATWVRMQVRWATCIGSSLRGQLLLASASRFPRAFRIK